MQIPRGPFEDSRDHRSGIVLLITLVILVILATLGYSLSAQVAARRHRSRYLMDYTAAQYACTSAMKCALASLNDLSAEPVSDPNSPDFSDVFAMSETNYQAMLARYAQLAKKHAAESGADHPREELGRSEDMNDPNDTTSTSSSVAQETTVPGPYGPRWPLVREPWEFEIASAHVTVEVEDENAKYPLGWALITDEKLQAQANVSFATFCEWMGYSAQEIGSLKKELSVVGTIRPFSMTFSPISVPMARPVSVRTRATSTRNTGTGVLRAAPQKVVSVADQASQQSADLVRLFRGGMIDTDLLSRPSIASDSRHESAMKYLALWGSKQVNVNTAPRHVLEAAFAFGSIADGPKIADAVIKQRRIKPFASLDELKTTLSRYADSVDRCRDFLTTTSTVFTVRVTAVSGVAKVIALAGVTKEGRQVKRIAMMSD
jgi:hypothetical protein